MAIDYLDRLHDFVGDPVEKVTALGSLPHLASTDAGFGRNQELAGMREPSGVAGSFVPTLR